MESSRALVLDTCSKNTWPQNTVPLCRLCLPITFLRVFAIPFGSICSTLCSSKHSTKVIHPPTFTEAGSSQTPCQPCILRTLTQVATVGWRVHMVGRHMRWRQPAWAMVLRFHVSGLGALLIISQRFRFFGKGRCSLGRFWLSPSAIS